MSAGTTVHATALVVGKAGVLIRGVAGSGKSALALALIEDPRGDAALVADDRVHLWSDEGGIFAAPAPELAGLIELRGVGVLRRPHRQAVPLHLVVDLLPAEACPRLPEEGERAVELHGRRLPRLAIPIGTPDGALRIRIAVAEWIG